MERKAKGIKLTAAGENLYEYSKQIAQSLDEFDPLSSGKKDLDRPFKIATYDNIACSIFSDFGKALTSIFPKISISVGGPNSRILGDLMGGKFDCALIAQPRILPGLEYKKMFSERYGIFMAKNVFKKSPLSKKKVLTLKNLKEYKLIAMPDAIAGSNRSVDRLLWEIGMNSVFSIDSYEVAIRLVLDGHGIGIMPYSSAWREVRDGNLAELSVTELNKSSLGRHDITLCWNSESDRSSLLKLEEMLLDSYRLIP